ncbi:hypothetical protein E4U42_003126, partial [Claviceps africana]
MATFGSPGPIECEQKPRLSVDLRFHGWQPDTLEPLTISRDVGVITEYERLIAYYGTCLSMVLCWAYHARLKGWFSNCYASGTAGNISPASFDVFSARCEASISHASPHLSAAKDAIRKHALLSTTILDRETGAPAKVEQVRELEREMKKSRGR